MRTLYNRRRAIALGLAGLAGLSAFGFTGCDTAAATPSSLSQSGPVSLQMTFWGSTTRDKLTRQALDLFHKSHPDISITSQFKDFNNYFGMLDSLIAAGKTPDLIQMDMRFVAGYVRKGLLLDETQFISKQTIDLSDFDPTLLSSSKVNNTIYGIPLGGNYQAYIYDKTALAQAGFGELPETITWDDFGTYTSQLTKALGNGTYGTADNSGDIISFEVWIRQRGKELYTHDGGLGFDVTDATDWYDYWNKQRQVGSCPPMNIQSTLDITGSPTDSSVSKGKAVFGSLWSNQLDAWQRASQRPLGLTMLPTGSTPGQYLKASMLLSISAQTQHQVEAASFINFLINDPTAVEAIAIERGVPGSLKARALLNPRLTAAQQGIISYMDMVSKSANFRVKEVLDPPGAGAVATALLHTSQAIGFGQTTVQDGAKSFYTAAQKAITPT